VKQENNDFDWFKWAGIKPSQFTELVDEARKNGVPVFEADSKEDIFNRLMSVKTLENNKSTMKINKALTVITFLSMVVTVVTAFFK